MKVTVLLKKPSVSAAIFYLVVAAVFVLQMGDIAMSALIVPLLCIGIITGCALLSLVFSEPTDEKVSVSGKELRIMLAISLFVGLIYLLGFYVASTLFTIAIFWLLSTRGVKQLVIAVCYASLLTLSVYLLFAVSLDYFVPLGLVGQWLQAP